MLYENPRGVGCNKCHARGDKNVLIAKYKEYDKKSKKSIEKVYYSPSYK